MSISTTTIRREVVGRARIRTVEITFDSSYPTGGESFDPESVGLNKVDMAVIAPAAGYVFEYDYASNKIKAFRSDAVSGHTHTFTGTPVTPTFTGAADTPTFTGTPVTPTFTGDELSAVPGTPTGTISQVTPAGTVSSVTPSGTVSEVTPAGSNSTAGSSSAAALAEVSNGTNLSTVVTRAFLVGV